MGHNSPVANLFGGGTPAISGQVLQDVKTNIINHPAAAAPDPTDPPKIEDARQTAFQDERRDLKRRRASTTLLSGGSMADTPTTASATLLGF